MLGVAGFLTACCLVRFVASLLCPAPLFAHAVIDALVKVLRRRDAALCVGKVVWIVHGYILLSKLHPTPTTPPIARQHPLWHNLNQTNLEL